MVKTNVMRLLDAAGIPYRAGTYEVDENDLSGSHAADLMGVDHDTMYKTLVLKGEKKGYLVCRTDDNDGRCKKIVLTQKGEETHAATVRVIDMLHEELEQNVTQEEKQVFLNVIEKMKNNINDMNKEDEQC